MSGTRLFCVHQYAELPCAIRKHRSTAGEAHAVFLQTGTSLLCYILSDVTTPPTGNVHTVQLVEVLLGMKRALAEPENHPQCWLITWACPNPIHVFYLKFRRQLFSVGPVFGFCDRGEL